MLDRKLTKNGVVYPTYPTTYTSSCPIYLYLNRSSTKNNHDANIDISSFCYVSCLLNKRNTSQNCLSFSYHSRCSRYRYPGNRVTQRSLVKSQLISILKTAKSNFPVTRITITSQSNAELRGLAGRRKRLRVAGGFLVTLTFEEKCTHRLRRNSAYSLKMQDNNTWFICLK